MEQPESAEHVETLEAMSPPFASQAAAAIVLAILASSMIFALWTVFMYWDRVGV